MAAENYIDLSNWDGDWDDPDTDGSLKWEGSSVIYGTVLRTTPKALLVRRRFRRHWLARSHIQTDLAEPGDCGRITITKWLADTIEIFRDDEE